MKHFNVTFLLTILFLMVGAKAFAYDAYIDGICYNYSGGNATVTYMNVGHYSGTIVIPASVTYSGKTYNVTSIGDRAFYGCRDLTSITIPESVKSIGDNAFNGCSGLTSITIPESVTSIGDNAFLDCRGLTSITIFEGVTSIGSSAFHGTAWYNNQPDGLIYVGNIVYKFKGTMPNNTSIELKEDTKGIAGSAFEGCCGLTSISMPEGVTSIGDQAFDGCSSLTSIAIPESVMSIGNSAFRDCSCLTSIIINLPTVGSWFSGLHSIKEVQLGKKVTTIGDSAFYGSTLYSLIVGSGVLSISPSAFSSKPTKTIWLTNTPPEGYETAEGMVNYAANEQYASLTNNTVYPFLSSMFEVDGIRYVPVSPSERICDAIDCLYSSSATNVHIGKTVDFRGIQMSVKVVKPYTCYQHPYLEGALLDFEGNLGENAFYGCTSLKEVTIDNKGDVGEQAFYGCKSLTDVSAMNDGKIGKSAFSGCTALEKVIIKNNGDIGSRAFYGCSSLEDVTISNNGDIGKEAFYESSINGKLVISNEGFIGISAFSNIEGGVDVIINNAKSIQPSSFANSFGLNTLELGERITTIGNQAFKDCKNLRSIRDLHKGGIAGEAFANCFSLQTVTLGDSITSLGKSAFRGCSALQEIKLPDAVQTLGSSAFQDCTSLTSVDMGNGVGAIAGSAFLGCSALTDIRVGRQVQSIGTNAFSGCSSLPQIVLPQSVESIGDYVFQGCKSLKAMVMEELSDDAASSELSLGSNGSSPLFADCPLDSVFIGRNITYSTASSEGYSPFYRNTSLRAVTITDKETEISPNEFYGCTNLKNVRIGDGVERIGDWAFSGCSSLEYFAFGARVKNIGTEAFSDCNSVTQIISRAITPPACGAQALDDINKWNCKLIVPQGKLKDYQAADQWKDFFFAEEVDMGFTHKLTYMVDGEEYKTCDYEFGMSIVPEDTPTKEGYTFSGWIGLPQMMPNQDVIVTGSFTINQYSVKFIVDGEVISEQKLDFGSVITVPENPAKEGYTFSGWSDIPEIVPAIDVVIYGSFAVNKYILIYMLDGEEYKKVSVDYGTSLTAEEAPKKEGYTFSGWNDVPTTMPAHDVTVIGSFTVNTYMVRYYVGDQLIAEDEVEYGAEVVLRDYTSDDASRYSFAGWEGEVYATMPAHDIEYHAIIVDFIVDMSGTSNHVQAIYDTNGRKLTKPQRGVNILLMRDGSKRKLVVK